MSIRCDADEIISFLNSLAQIDPIAMGKLVSARVACNATMADHPTVQVSSCQDGFEIGFLGLINGYAGTYDDGKWKGWGPVCAVVEDDGSVAAFRRTDAWPS